MCRFIDIILLAFIWRAHAEKLVVDGTSNVQDSLKVVDNFLQHALEVSPLYHAEKVDTTFGNRDHHMFLLQKVVKSNKPLRAFASLLATSCAFMGSLRQPERASSPPKQAVTQNVLDVAPERQNIDFSSAQSLINHGYWQEEALNLEPLLVQPEDPAGHLHRHGVARIPDVLSKGTANALRDVVLAELSASTELDDPDLLANHFSAGVFNTRAKPDAPQTRWELRLPMNAAVRAALGELTSGTLGSVLAQAAGPDAELWELSALISAPGSAPQIIHADTKFTPRPSLITTFVALQDVTSTMGPTSYVPGTHTDVSAHMDYMRNSLGFLSAADGRSSIMDIGDATVYDSRILHCGGANRSDRIRVLLVLTFRHEGTSKNSEWSPNSIRAEVAGRHTLRSLSRRAALV